MDEGGKEEKGFDFFGKGAEKKKEAVEEPKVKAADFFDSLLWLLIFYLWGNKFMDSGVEGDEVSFHVILLNWMSFMKIF